MEISLPLLYFVVLSPLTRLPTQHTTVNLVNSMDAPPVPALGPGFKVPILRIPHHLTAPVLLEQHNSDPWAIKQGVVLLLLCFYYGVNSFLFANGKAPV